MNSAISRLGCFFTLTIRVPFQHLNLRDTSVTLAFYCHPHLYPLPLGWPSWLALCPSSPLLSQKPLVASWLPFSNFQFSPWPAILALLGLTLGSTCSASPQPYEKPSTVCILAITLFQAACYCWRRSGSWLHYKAWPASSCWAPRAMRRSFYTWRSHFPQ